uniref:Calmodulin-like n=1 Tax=Saccoglossus kowalevskii TaxID=10224 RepID=A0ABM0MNN6_SACKO|nr:PREDICTED: calmodulin-like [Saccoglossus kowalevskii]
MATPLSTELMEAFNKYDTDNDGLLTMNQLEQVLKALGQTATDTDIRHMVAGSETHSDDTAMIELSRFIRTMSRKMSDNNGGDALKAAFRVYDKNGDGFISEAKIRHVMDHVLEKATPAEVEEMIRKADSNGDGNINYEEFEKMLLKKELDCAECREIYY